MRKGSLNAWSALAVALGFGAHAPRGRRDHHESMPVAAVSNALMLIPRVDFEALGGFDDGYATDCADLDLCLRVSKAGGVVIQETAASGVQFAVRNKPARREVQGLSRFIVQSASTPSERAFATVAAPAIGAILASRKLIGAVFGEPPRQ
jgi:hypothetical protein